MARLRLSVVIPYYNNERTLKRCLQSFALEQSLRPDEIVVVDDGSMQPAKPIVDAFRSPVPIRHLHGDHGGQSRASNLGVAAADGDVVLLSCADIVANDTFVEVHATEHEQARARGESIAVMGHIAYPPWMPMTPFLQFLADDGPQFSFGAISQPDNVDGAMLYSPNFSIERAWMHRLGGFDELLPYGFQDTDFGLRLVEAKIRLMYRKQALAHHDHPNDLPSFVRRNRSVGQYLYRMFKRHPSLFSPDRLRFSLTLMGSSQSVLGDLLAATTKLERAVTRGLVTGPKPKQQLFSLYEQVIAMAFFEGAIAGDVRLGEALGMREQVWSAIRQRKPVSDPAYRDAAANREGSRLRA